MLRHPKTMKLKYLGKLYSYTNVEYEKWPTKIVCSYTDVCFIIQCTGLNQAALISAQVLKIGIADHEIFFFFLLPHCLRLFLFTFRSTGLEINTVLVTFLSGKSSKLSCEKHDVGLNLAQTLIFLFLLVTQPLIVPNER